MPPKLFLNPQNHYPLGDARILPVLPLFLQSTLAPVDIIMLDPNFFIRYLIITFNL